jgi:hypothetical protein
MLCTYNNQPGIMLQLRFIPQEGYFLAHLSGLVSVESWDQGLRDLDEAIGDKPGDRLLVNLTGLVGWLGVPERTAVGALWAARLGRMKKVALYIQPEKIAGVVQAEARRKGLDLRLFPAFDEAVRWVVS